MDAGRHPAGGHYRPAADHPSASATCSQPKNIPWKYYGGGYNLSVAGNPINGYCNICNPFRASGANYPAMRADHMRDVTDLFVDIQNGTLPAVSYVKPDGAIDGHPASSKFNIFEAFTGNPINLSDVLAEFITRSPL